MKYNRDIHHRRSIRLRNYDYARAGAYFLTICTKNRGCLFGNIMDGKMGKNDAGNMIQNVWNALPERFDNLVLCQA
jgi:REP element-mobilizing transposase RayT